VLPAMDRGSYAPLGNALLESALEQRQQIDRRLHEVPAEIARAQELIARLLAEKAELQQQKRRADALVAFASAPRMLRQDRYCPGCHIRHGNRTLLVVVPGSAPLGQYRCVLCDAVYVLEPERAMEARNPPTAVAASVRLYLPNTNKERHTCV
jgi:hypothetical protein